MPEATDAPPLMLDALWARAEGRRATELRPINPVNFVVHRGGAQSRSVTTSRRFAANGVPSVSRSMPGMHGVEYLATVHMQDNNVEPHSLRMVTASSPRWCWMTRTWTKDEFLNTLAARGEFGYGWRGVHAVAASGSTSHGRPP